MTADAAGIYARESPILDRHVQLGVAQKRVISLSFPTEPDAAAGTDHELLDRIEGYLEGTEDEFDDVTVALTMPTDQREILEALREVPYGEETSVGQLARMTPGLNDDDDDDIVRVREALAANPVPLLIPDHRVRDGPSAAPTDVIDTLRSLESL